MFDSKDLLHGARGIGECLGMEDRDVYYLIETTDIPAFKVGRRLFARRSDLDEWFRPRPGNSAARGGSADDGGAGAVSTGAQATPAGQPRRPGRVRKARPGGAAEASE